MFPRICPVFLLLGAASCSKSPSPPIAVVENQYPNQICEDNTHARATIEPALDAPLFHQSKSSVAFPVIEREDGSMENTLGEPLTADQLLRVEHTAACVSGFMGDHDIAFSEAIETAAGGVILTLLETPPGYFEQLHVTIDRDLSIRCSFAAVSPAGTAQPRWRIVKKAVRLRSGELTPRTRLFGSLSVEVEEITDATPQPAKLTIEGYFKPVIQNIQPRP